MKNLVMALDPYRKLPIDLKSEKVLKNWGRFMARKMNCTLSAASFREAPIKNLVELSNRQQNEMLILGTHGRTGIRRMWIGSVAEEVIRRSGIPVFILGPKGQEKNLIPASGKKMKLLVSTDLGKGSRQAEEFAIRFAKKTGAEIVLLHALYQGKDPMIQMALTTSEGQKAVADLFKDLRQSSLQKLKRKQRKIIDMGIKCEILLDERYVFSERSLDQAIKSQKADLVITGTNSRSLVGKFYFGSTTRSTILNSPVPVIVVRNN